MQFNHILVTPFDQAILSKLKGYRVVVKIEDDEQLHPFLDHLANNEINLHAVWVNTNKKLSEINLSDLLGSMPIALYVSEVGDLTEVIRKLPLLHQLNIKIFLDGSQSNNYEMLQVLSSLNVFCGLFFNKQEVYWEEFNDLIYYFLYSTARHAPIEPIHYIAENYSPDKKIDFNSIYFNDTNKFLHIDADENIALKSQYLVENNFITKGFDKLHEISTMDEYQAELNRWQDFFINNAHCSVCEAWRICLGKFSYDMSEECSKTFIEILDGVEKTKRNSEMNRMKKNIWQY